MAKVGTPLLRSLVRIKPENFPSVDLVFKSIKDAAS